MLKKNKIKKRVGAFQDLQNLIYKKVKKEKN